MDSIQASFEQLADTELWTDAAAVGAGYIGASLANSLLEGATAFDVPNEAFGVGVTAGALYVDVPYSDQIAVGGGLYAIDGLAQRFGMKQQITEMGA